MIRRLLFLENQDSFSWNVIDRLPCAREQVIVRSGRAAMEALPLVAEVDGVVVGPGPTDPWRAGLVDFVRQAALARRPLIGVCLGHQALGLAFGARLVRTEPAHGVRSTAQFVPSRSFPGFVGAEVVMRYHSLALADVASPLRVIAVSDDGVVMAIEHESLPLAGVQFHPDSYATPRGEELLASFFEARR